MNMLLILIRGDNFLYTYCSISLNVSGVNRFHTFYTKFRQQFDTFIYTFSYILFHIHYHTMTS